jgi:cytoskeletal protein CcmA (bactofilin family)
MMALFNKEQMAREPEAVRRERMPENQPPPPIAPVQALIESGAAPAKLAATPASEPFSAPRRPSSEARAYLDQGCKISGRLEFEEAARIDGQIDGEIIARDGLLIGESAVVTAKIKASSIVVAGTVSGEIVASQRLEIHASAKVSGNLTTPKLIVHEGAAFEGYCAMQSDGAHKERNGAAPDGERRTLARAHEQKQAS